MHHPEDTRAPGAPALHQPAASGSADQKQTLHREPGYAGEPPLTGASTSAQPEKKKKRLTQACQHCRKKKIRCDGIRPSCKNCIKNKSPCTYVPSVRKRGRNGMRMPTMPPFVASGPYDRPMQAHTMALASGGGSHLSASIRQQGHMLSQGLQQQQHQHPQQSVFSIHSQGHSMPPPPTAASQMRAPPPPQINPLGSNYESGGPVSLHLKRDPGFGQDLLGESGYDPAKQAAEMSSFFMLPVNNLQFPSYAPGATSFGSHVGPSNRMGQSSGSSNGSNPAQMYRASSLASTGANTMRGNSMGGESAAGMVSSAGMHPGFDPASFDPTVLAQGLSSAYVSVIAGMSPQGQAGRSDSSGPARISHALGKSASNTPVDSHNVPDSAKMRELRAKIRAIISSVWADTECGRSAGMAGVTMADDEDDCHEQSPAQRAGSTALVSLSGDRSLDDHLLALFFEFVHPQLPIISRTVFQDAYSRGRVPPLLVSAMGAAASVFLNRIETERKAIYEQYSQKVREHFHDACFEPSLEVVQTALIMTLCEYRNGSLHRAWVYLSMGFRLAIAMGYHHHDAKLRAGPVQSSPDIAYRETCRRAFWGAFILDRYMAIGGGKALGINDNDITVLLPLQDEDWHNRSTAPPLSTLEFFKPLNTSDSGSTRSVSLGSIGAAAQAAGAIVSEPMPNSVEPEGVMDMHRHAFDSSIASSPMTGSSSGSRNGSAGLACEWDGRATDVNALGHFIKLMTVVGQVAQYINSSKGAAGASSYQPRRDRPSRDYAVLDAALQRWKKELPSALVHTEVQAADAEPDRIVFMLCMHAVYHGAVIMLSRENMELLRDLPGQLDVSTNLAIRSLERCRVAAMEVVEIANHISTLPAAKTSALLPWALFQAGTLLIHFMIAGSTAQAQEEARAAILTLDCVLRDELSRYWNVSSKYHLVLSNMVKAWERTRQATPSMTPQQRPLMSSSGGRQASLQAQTGPAYGDSAAETFQALNAHLQMPMQMQMHMQLPTHMATSQSHSKSEVSSEPFTLLKPYRGPNAGATDQRNNSNGVESTANDSSFVPNFMFTANTAQDSMNTLNEFLTQLTQEQARQFSEGMQTYSLQGSRANSAMAAVSGAQQNAISRSGYQSNHMYPQNTQQQAVTLTNAALQHIQSAAFDMGQGSRVHDRRGSLPISSTSDLFTAPGGQVFSPVSAAPAASFGQINNDSMMNPELDPFLFNPMTPFLQELQMFNGSNAHQPAVSGSTAHSASSSMNRANTHSHT
ncbi:hypothetical protein IW142_002816 [Coemansia sp. RSA 564]|nr:hypothetical protein IW142_002816 [Coemansia sp. RSA 564]